MKWQFSKNVASNIQFQSFSDGHGSVNLEMQSNNEMKGQSLSSHYNDYKVVSDTKGLDSQNGSQDTPLHCYECNSIHDGDLCYSISRNNTNLADFENKVKRCPSDHKFCKVRNANSTILLPF